MRLLKSKILKNNEHVQLFRNADFTSYFIHVNGEKTGEWSTELEGVKAFKETDDDFISYGKSKSSKTNRKGTKKDKALL